MAVEYDANGTPILTNDSLISDVPPYTQALAATGVGGGVSGVKDSKFNDLQPADPISPFPIGMLAPFMGENAPDGWLLCDGRSYDAAYFYALAEANPDFHADGTFRVPDLRGRSPVGVTGAGVDTGDDEILDPIGLGTRWGDARVPNHNHDIVNQGGGAITASDGAGMAYAIHFAMHCYGNGADPISAIGRNTGFGANNDGRFTPIGNGRNMPPYTGVNFIVYTGKPTLDTNGDILAECGQGAEIAPVTTRMMIEARLAEAGIGEEEVKMLKEQLEEIKKTEAK
jgi:microcystin-dependent protein